MGFAPVFGDVALASSARAAGTFTSGPVAAAGVANAVVVGVHVSAVSGSPTLDVSLEESDDASSWSAITGSSATQLSAAGNAVAFAAVSKRYVRVTATVAGTTPSVTFSVSVMVR